MKLFKESKKFGFKWGGNKKQPLDDIDLKDIIDLTDIKEDDGRIIQVHRKRRICDGESTSKWKFLGIHFETCNHTCCDWILITFCDDPHDPKTCRRVWGKDEDSCSEESCGGSVFFKW